LQSSLGSNVAEDPLSPIATPSESAGRPAEPEEFEIVLGRRQVASLLFVGTVIVVIASAMSYLAAKALAARDAGLDSPTKLSFAPPPAATENNAAIPAVDATIIKAADLKGMENLNAVERGVAPSGTVPRPQAAEQPDAPLFSEPLPGAVYIQMGAVEKGIAIVLTEGLRKRGFEAFVAPGPNEKIFRVLIGPLADPASFQRAKDGVDDLGLSTFARRYQK
jgi:cell division septation protein DedD